MIPTNRLFSRREPTRDAKSLYIFCEGKKREYQYFNYFKGIDSRINIEVYPLKGNEDNSPTGLLQLAYNCFNGTETGSSPKYDLLKGDEVWFVVDTDRWDHKLKLLRDACTKEGWYIAQSNPCFEVWLYYHLFEKPATFPWIETCSSWKEHLANNIEGGFNSGKHPVNIGLAMEYARVNFQKDGDAPAVGSSNVFELAAVIYSFCSRKIEGIRNKI